MGMVGSRNAKHGLLANWNHRMIRRYGMVEDAYGTRHTTMAYRKDLGPDRGGDIT